MKLNQTECAGLRSSLLVLWPLGNGDVERFDNLPDLDQIYAVSDKDAGRDNQGAGLRIFGERQRHVEELLEDFSDSLGVRVLQAEDLKVFDLRRLLIRGQI